MRTKTVLFAAGIAVLLFVQAITPLFPVAPTRDRSCQNCLIPVGLGEPTWPPPPPRVNGGAGAQKA